MAIANNPWELSGRIGDLTFYQKNGKTIVRPAFNSNRGKKRKKVTVKQLGMRQRLMHINIVWRKLQETGHVYLEGGSSECHRFRSINKYVPIVFLPARKYVQHASLLLPGLVLSDGPLPTISYELSEVDGKPALFTDLTMTEARKDTLLLYVLRQDIEVEVMGYKRPVLSIRAIPVNPDEEIKADEFGTARLVNVPSTLLTPYHEKGGTVAIVGDMFADSMLGFCLVRVKDGRASTQQVVTNCEYYKHFTTKTAIKDALPSRTTLVEW